LKVIFCKFEQRNRNGHRNIKNRIGQDNPNIDNGTFLKKVMDFINNEKSDFWNELSAAEQAEIKLGIDQLNQGKRTSYEEVLKEIS